MKLSNAIFANVLLAGGLLAVPAFAANNNDATISGATRTDVVAEGRGGGGEEGREGRPDWKKPRFTDDQLIQMAALKDRFATTTASQKAQIMSLHRQLRGAMAKADINRSEVLSLQSQINTIHDDLATKKMNEKLDFIALLTPEQKEHFRHHMLVANAFGGHQGGWGHGGGGCGAGGHGGGEHHGHHHMGQRGPGGPGGPGGGARVGFEGQGPGPVAFEGPEPMEGPDAQ